MLCLLLLALGAEPVAAVITAGQTRVTWTGTPTVYGPPVDPNAAAAAAAAAQAKQQAQQQMTQAIGQMLQQSNVNTGPKGWAAGGGDTPRGSQPPPPGTDFEHYSYPDDYVYSSGSKGMKGIKNGLCESDTPDPNAQGAKAVSIRQQVSAGYCDLLLSTLRDENSCAHRQVQAIIQQAGSSGQGVGGLTQFCSNWSTKDNSDKVAVFQQILAALITRESGWNPRATEKAWGGTNNFHQGKGLFQIGTWYASRDPDCGGLNDGNIYDPAVNIKCGACVALSDLAKDMTMGHGVGDSGARGMARTFGPFRDGQSAIRSSIAGATNQYCTSRGPSGSGGGGSSGGGSNQDSAR